jgi:hypothetical protein
LSFIFRPVKLQCKLVSYNCSSVPNLVLVSVLNLRQQNTESRDDMTMAICRIGAWVGSRASRLRLVCLKGSHLEPLLFNICNMLLAFLQMSNFIYFPCISSKTNKRIYFYGLRIFLRKKGLI